MNWLKVTHELLMSTSTPKKKGTKNVRHSVATKWQFTKVAIYDRTF